MTETIREFIHIEGITPVILTGANSNNLIILSKYSKCSINLRGNQIVAEGKPQDIERLKISLRKLLSLARGGSTIGEQEILESLAYQEDELGDSDFLNMSGKIINPRTGGQKNYIESMLNNDLTVAIGPAGTGKTFLGVAMAVKCLKEKFVEKIVLARPAVEAGERLGFLPGDLKEKVNPYLQPMYDALGDIYSMEKLSRLIENGSIEVIPLAFMRGRTFNRAFVILDEAQNTTSGQMKMFLTRLGFYSKAVITGDITQIDLPNGTVSGLVEIREILSNIPRIAFCYLEKRDIIRHPLVQEIVQAYERYESRKIEKQ
ncbi:MAG: PhoH family protein [Candidatus Coatesbacteria bacterium]|nr:PhoH family protein [Candidatus Coatesbacteria bacterium]